MSAKSYMWKKGTNIVHFFFQIISYQGSEILFTNWLYNTEMAIMHDYEEILLNWNWHFSNNHSPYKSKHSVIRLFNAA